MGVLVLLWALFVTLAALALVMDDLFHRRRTR
jgi:hypothetical protein